MEKSSDAALVGPLCHSGSTCNGCGFDRYVTLAAVSIQNFLKLAASLQGVQAKPLGTGIGVDFFRGIGFLRCFCGFFWDFLSNFDKLTIT